MPLVGICDDEKEIRAMLADLVRKYCPGAELCIYKDGSQVLDGRTDPDILFLDIQMPGMDGMAVARELRTRNCRTVLIFVTALEEYVFESFDVRAFHYLVKPFSEEKFAAVLAHACQCSIEQKEQQKAAVGPTGAKEQARCLLVKSGGMHIRVPFGDIMFAEVFNRKVMLHKTDGDLEYYGRMSELEQAAGVEFVRTHRSYLVNMKYVEKYDAQAICLEGGSQVPIAKQKYPLFVKAYLRYMKN